MVKYTFDECWGTWNLYLIVFPNINKTIKSFIVELNRDFHENGV